MDQTTENLRRLASYTERVQAGDMDAIFEMFAPNFQTHVAERVSPDAVGMDQRPGEVMFWQESAAAFPDRSFAIHKVWVVDEGTTVITHYSMTGTHTGAPFFGKPADGKAVEINGTAIMRLENGQIVEHWGGPHCMYGIGLVDVANPPTRPTLTRRIEA
jgi:predicted ester cyclase